MALDLFMVTKFSALTAKSKPTNPVSWLNFVMPTLQERLAEIMEAKKWAYPDLVRVSGESRSVVSQWLGRSSKTIKSIGKVQAAERIEAESGYAALWIAKGLGPKMLPAAEASDAAGASATPFVPSSPGARYLVLRLGELLATLDSTDKKSASGILHDLALKPEDAPRMAEKLGSLLGERAPIAEGERALR
jgi:transcriptional regulator with XRE-family HTH domain